MKKTFGKAFNGSLNEVPPEIEEEPLEELSIEQREITKLQEILIQLQKKAKQTEIINKLKENIKEMTQQIKELKGNRGFFNRIRGNL